ncbi:hypothetical protein [Shimia sp. SDUM112013]|uniref:hypothetical protein n=1 Tax=Shimia sp. SDUM112013 TaxID=3136160 RepID=UPI0032EC2F0C
MLGVVLWSNNQDNKAVIWCEDQGDLAYFNGGDEVPLEMLDLDAGDLVQFELQQERHLRYAKNPRRIEQGAYAGLPDDLHAAASAPKAVEPVAPARRKRTACDVIPFMRPKRSSRTSDLVVA